jgi:hypothetical protein
MRLELHSTMGTHQYTTVTMTGRMQHPNLVQVRYPQKSRSAASAVFRVDESQITQFQSLLTYDPVAGGMT